MNISTSSKDQAATTATTVCLHCKVWVDGWRWLIPSKVTLRLYLAIDYRAFSRWPPLWERANRFSLYKERLNYLITGRGPSEKSLCTASGITSCHAHVLLVIDYARVKRDLENSCRAQEAQLARAALYMAPRSREVFSREAT